MAASSDRKREKDLRVLAAFVGVFCRRKHGTPKGRLCGECSELLAYARQRLEKCPFDPKPKCKNCTVHCYRPERRRQIREVMKFSGMHFVRRGRLDWLVKYFLSKR